ncbi:hypothetical protein [Dryocola clanedunensis]
MSATAAWANTAPCTIWRRLDGYTEAGDPLGYDPPLEIMCDYIGGLSEKIGPIGKEVVVKNTFFTEFALAKKGDYVLIGSSIEADPLVAGADEIAHVTRWGDTFDRVSDDWAIITGV